VFISQLQPLVDYGPTDAAAASVAMPTFSADARLITLYRLTFGVPH